MNSSMMHDNKKINIERIAIRATRWVGSTQSLIVHTILFVGAFLFIAFGVSASTVLLVLTTIVSLEAIYLSIFIQMSVNRNSRRLHEVSKDIDEIQKDVDEIQEDVEDISEGVEEIQKDVEEIQEDVDEIQKDVDEIQEDVEELEEDFEEIAEEMDKDEIEDRTRDELMYGKIEDMIRNLHGTLEEMKESKQRSRVSVKKDK